MKIINCQTLGDMCEYMLDGEPVFLIRAQDIVSVQAVEAYLALTHNAQGKNQSRVKSQIQKMLEWQREHTKRIKVAD